MLALVGGFVPERKKRKAGTSRKGKKRPGVGTRMKSSAHGKAPEKSMDYFETVTSTMREPLLVLDAGFRVVSANKAFYDAYGVKREDVEGKAIFELGDRVWDLPMLRERLGEVLAEGRILDGFLVEHDFPMIGRRAMLVNARPMAEEAGHFDRIVLTFNDVTELKRAEEEVTSLSRFPAENPSPVMRISQEGKILYSNAASSLILNEWQCEIGQSAPESWRQLVADVFGSGTKREFEKEYGGRTFLFMLVPTGEAGYVNVYGRDITERRKAEEALRMSEERFRFALENSPIVVATLDRDLRYTWVHNPLGGFAPEEVLGKKVGVSTDPDTTEKMRKSLENVLTTGESVSWETKIKGKTGDMFLDSHAEPLRNAKGEVTGIAIISIDITERKKAEDELRKARDELEVRVHERTRELSMASEKLQASSLYVRSLIEASLDPLVTINVKGKITDVNRATEEATGFPREQLIGSDFSDYFTDPEKARKGYQRVFTEGFVRDYPLAIRHRSGKIADVLYNATVYTNEKGETQGVFAAARDITERKHAEEELIRLSSAVKMSTESIVISDLDGRILDANEAAIRGYGANDRSDLIGKSSFDLIAPEDREKALEGLKEVLEKGYVTNREYNLVIKDGSTIPVEMSVSIIKDAGGKPTGLVGISRNITERKRSEESVKAERKRFIDVMEKLPAYLILLTPDYHVSYANRFFRERFGESGGRRCFEYLFGRSEACENCETYKTLEKMAPLEWEWTGPDGRNYYIYDSPFTDVDGSTLILEVGIDITERKKVEEALKKAHDELELRIDERTMELKEASEALQESEIDLNRAQAVARTGSWRLDVQRNRLLWSDETYNMFGVPKGTPLTYEAFLGNVHPDDREYVDRKWQAAIRGEPYDIEHRIVVNGETKWVREKAELESDHNGKLLGGFGTVQDITERKQIETALKETSEYLDSLLNYANAPIIVWDPEFKITKFNHAFEHMSGYKVDDVLGKHLSVLFPEKTREESLTEIQHTLAGEQWEGQEIPILRKDGNLRTVLWNSANIHAADGKTLVATIAQGQDITERKLLEEKLFQSERKYRSLYETSMDGIASADMEGRITECNDAYAQMLGYSKDELKALSYIQLTPEKWHQMEQEITREQVTKRGHSDLYEKELIRKDGSIVPVSIRVWLVRDEKWAPIGMWAIVRDVTRRKHLENELKRYSEHLEHLVDERTKKLKDAERLAAIGETAAMVGHDIRSPLQTVEGAIYLAKEEIKALPSRTQEISNIEEMLNSIHEETTYVNKIVSDLQDYARPLEPQLEEIDTKQLINGALATVHIPSTVEVAVTVEQNCCNMIVDPTMMKRILANLITNALQAMPDEGKLTIAAIKKQDEVHISVRDTGQGIPEENRAKIFQPLFSTKAKGQGFGLAVVKRLVEAHNGTITFNTEVGKGTAFTVVIPLAKEAS
jgi:PAS domain S-box-containing protein